MIYLSKPLALLFVLLLVSGPHTYLRAMVQEKGQEPTLVEDSPALPKPPPGTLATMAYKPTERETAFFQKLAADERVTGSLFSDYSITGKVGKYIGWFGIVRRIEENSDTRETRLRVEHKYFDGLTDTHILALSFSGGGDFTVALSGVGLGIKKLSLVRVYGTVLKEDHNVPDIQAHFVRQWDWGRFTFMDFYGKQKGNKEWQKLNKAGDRIYNPFPDEKYYVDRLGPRNP
jgi:hypothetical protein